MAQGWTMKGRVAGPSTTAVRVSAESDQLNYQLDVFRTILKVVIAICGLFSLVYLMTFVQQGAWPALVVGLTFFAITGYSAIASRRVNPQNLQTVARIWLALASWTVFSFGLLQAAEFTLVMALGACVVIVLAIFLEPVKNSYQWALGNIGAYVFVALLRESLQIPAFDLGILQPVVLLGAPIAVLLILTEAGRITTQYFKANLVQSEARRKQLEAQGRQLLAYTFETEQAKQKAERADQVKSAFLASMSHELRTPLNAIINFTRFVIDGDTGEINEEQEELLTDVVASARHLLSLINDVLDMSKIEAGSLNLFVEDQVDLQPVFESVYATGRGLLAEKPVQLKYEVEPDLPAIRCDRQRILQILLNLMSNACKFTQMGEITLRASRRGEELHISVIDNGPGIAQEDQSLIFEAFKQSRTGLQTGGGSGLGLAISKNLAEAHGGRLWLESTAGQGATFSLAIPIRSQALTPLEL